MSIYSLTHLTGRRRSDQRRIVVARFEVRRAPFLASIGGAIASLPLVVLTAMVAGPWGMLWVPVGAIAGNVLFASRQRGSMQLRHFEAIRNSMRAAGRLGGRRGANPLKGTFLISGQPFREPTFVLSQPTLAWNGGKGRDLFELHESRRRRPR